MNCKWSPDTVFFYRKSCRFIAVAGVVVVTYIYIYIYLFLTTIFRVLRFCCWTHLLFTAAQCHHRTSYSSRVESLIFISLLCHQAAWQSWRKKPLDHFSLVAVLFYMAVTTSLSNSYACMSVSGHVTIQTVNRNVLFGYFFKTFSFSFIFTGAVKIERNFNFFCGQFFLITLIICLNILIFDIMSGFQQEHFLHSINFVAVEA